MPYRKSRRVSRKHRKVHRKNKRTHSMRGGNSTFMPAEINPQVGSPYNAGDANPYGNYLPLSPYGVPSGGFDPPMPSNPQFGSQNGGRRSKSKRSRSSKRSSSKRSRSKRSRSNKSKRRSNRSRRFRQRGGDFSDVMTAVVPADLLNAGRSIPAAFTHMADRFSGLLSSPSSLVYPTQQPLVPQNPAPPAMNPPDLKAFYNNAVQSVSTI